MEDWSSPEKPWTNRQIRELRKAIVEGGDAIEGLSYAQIAVWYGQIIGDIVERINGIVVVDLPISDLHVSSRVKTITTLRDKLKRDPAMQIPRVHDVMGVRVAAQMSLSVQDIFVKRIEQVLPVAQVSDIRKNPHSGYRAVHAIVKLPNGVFCEVQVRTVLQDAWANCYELAGDICGRDIRYGGKPDHDDHGLVNHLQHLSELVALMEQASDRNMNDAALAANTQLLEIIQSTAEMLESNRDILKIKR